MNPNTQNQVWSKWVWFVVPGTVKERPFQNVKENVARFARKGFGSSTQMNIRQTHRGYMIELLTEGHPVQDPAYVQYMRGSFEKFFQVGFGNGTIVKMSAKLMAGDREGKPKDQMIILPSLRKGDHSG